MDDETYWREEVDKARRGQLELVRRAATGWSALFAAVLGVFGTVSFAGGLTGVEDLGGSSEWVIRAVTVVAALLALAATVLAGVAAGPKPEPSASEDWHDMRDATTALAWRSLALLKAAKWCGAGAAALVFLGSAYVVLAGKAEAEPEAPTVLVVVDGTVACGALSESDDGSLTVDGHALTGVDQVQVVPTCP